MPDTATRPTAPCTAAPAAPRYDIYLVIHKALRLLLGDTLALLGRTDPAHDGAVAAALAQTRELLDICETHYADEDRYVHPALERARPGSTAHVAHEHVGHLAAVEQLRELVQVVEASRPPQRPAALARLYRAAALFAAENLVHMHEEDVELNDVLWRHYTDDELLAIEADLVAQIPPAVMFSALRWMLPALNAPERAAFLGGARNGMPPPAFEAVLDLAREVLPAAEWRKLARDLELPAY